MRAMLAIALAVLAMPAPAAEPTMRFGGPGTMFGTWYVREFVVASDGSDSFATGEFPHGVLNIEEADDRTLSGTLEIYDRTVTMTGTVEYGAAAVTARLSGSLVIDGVTYRESYIGYVLPTWSNADEQLPTFIGTITQFDPQHPDAMGSTASFVAVHEF